MIEQAIKKIANKKDLSFDEANQVTNEIMENKASEVQKASFLTALEMKGATVEEIAGAAASMRSHALPFKTNEDVLEIVGTGGDGSNSFNISTTSALVVAAAGVPVAKHGNRAASSKSGAADVLEALGVKLNIPANQNEQILEKVGFAFLFAQEYHKAMRFVGPVRKELGIRTIFNVLGPLCNPAHAKKQLLGVYSSDLLMPMAHVLDKLGITDALVIHGQDGLDEASISGPTEVIELRNGKTKQYTIKPEDFGLRTFAENNIIGGTPQDNARITEEVLSGKPGAHREVVLLNAGLALYTALPQLGIQGGIDRAKKAIDSGAALDKLNEVVKATEAVA